MEISISEQMEKILKDYEEEQRRKWENMTIEEQLDTYRENGTYKKYCDMTIEELQKEKKFQKETADRLRNSMFHDIFYSAYGCEENIRRINRIIKIKEGRN